MAQYRIKPALIDAIKFTRGNWIEVVEFTGGLAHTLKIEKRINGIATCIIPTLNGERIANEGDYIVRVEKGEYYPIKPGIFEMNYEPITE